MRLAVLFSGGKDSAMATYEVLRKGHEVTNLVTMLPDNPHSYMFHYPNVKWTREQGECMGIPVIQERTAGVKEEELDDMKKVLATLDVDGVVSGALASKYQKSRVDNVCKELGIKSVAPLWQKGEKRLFRRIIDLGFEIIMAGVSAEGLDDTWLGRVIDWEAIDELGAMGTLHIMLEGGEGETFVTDGPIFKKRIKITSSEKHWDGTCGRLDIKRVELVEKG